MKLVEKYMYLIYEGVKDSIKKHFKVEDKDFEKRTPKSCVKSIAKTKNGYVGFSHRAACEFKIGNKLFDPKWKGDNLSEKELDKIKFIERGETKIKTMDQAREAACNFAEYVS